MLSADLAHLMETEMSMLVGSVGSDGRPFAARGPGIRVIDPVAGVVRVLLDADDTRTPANLAARGRIAITSSSVRGFGAVQLKGTPGPVGPASEEDLAAAEVWADGFLRTVSDVDGYAWDRLQRWRRRSLVAVEVQVDQVYNQTPGPAAGDVLEGSQWRNR